MSTVNVKLGNNTLNGVDTVKIPDATTPSTLHEFSLGGGASNRVIFTSESSVDKGLCGVGITCGFINANYEAYGLTPYYPDGGSQRPYSLEDVPIETIGGISCFRAMKVYYQLESTNAAVSGSTTFDEEDTKIYIINANEWASISNKYDFEWYLEYDDDWAAFLQQYEPIKTISLSESDFYAAHETGRMVELDITGVPSNVPILVTTNGVRQS